MESRSIWQIILIALLLLLLNVVVPRLLKRFAKGMPVDPIAEATVFLAYGRKEQALEVLRDALVVSPNSKDILAKMRDIEGR